MSQSHLAKKYKARGKNQNGGPYQKLIQTLFISFRPLDPLSLELYLGSFNWPEMVDWYFKTVNVTRLSMLLALLGQQEQQHKRAVSR